MVDVCISLRWQQLTATLSCGADPSGYSVSAKLDRHIDISTYRHFWRLSRHFWRCARIHREGGRWLWARGTRRDRIEAGARRRHHRSSPRPHRARPRRRRLWFHLRMMRRAVMLLTTWVAHDPVLDQIPSNPSYAPSEFGAPSVDGLLAAIRCSPGLLNGRGDFTDRRQAGVRRSLALFRCSRLGRLALQYSPIFRPCWG